jgi:hypothetical protein
MSMLEVSGPSPAGSMVRLCAKVNLANVLFRRARSLGGRFAHRSRNDSFSRCGNIDHKNATLAGRVMNLDVSALRPDRPSRDPQPQAEPGAVLRAAFTERLKQGTVTLWNSPARVLHLDGHARIRWRVPA